jgi:gliding motility-associated-like protein
VDGICPVELQQRVNIHQVIANFIRENGTDTSICISKGPYQLIDSSISADSFKWFFGDGKTSNIDVKNHTYTTPGTYDITLAIANTQFGCKDTITKQAVVFANPVLITYGDTVCQGVPAHPKVLNPDSTYKYLWTPFASLSDSSAANPTSHIVHSLNYNVMATDTNRCTSNANVPVIIIEPINLHDWDTSIVVGDQVTLPVFGPPVYIFNWTPDTGLSCLTCNYPLTRPLKDITYNLNVTDIRGCFPAYNYLFKIEVKPETFVKLPSLFTPDGDGANDRLYVKGWGIKELLEFEIFDRWGQVMYSSTDINEGWDGTFKGVIQNSDMYAWKVRVLTWREETIQKEGYVNLLH